MVEYQLLYRLAFGSIARVMSPQHRLESFARQQVGFFSPQHADLGVQCQLVKMFLHQFQAKTVQRRNVRGLEQCQLLGQPPISTIGSRKFLQFVSQPVAHLRGRGFCERHQQQPIERQGAL